MITEIFPYIGYHPNGFKNTPLGVKARYLENATAIFVDTGIQHLGDL